MFYIRDNIYSHTTDKEVPTLVSKIPPDVYFVGVSQSGLIFKQAEQSKEELIEFNTIEANKLKKEIECFFNKNITDKLREHGISHRRGIIIHGEPGSGKTSLVRSMFDIILENDAVIILECNADMIQHNIVPAIRGDDPDRPIVFVWDEFEKNSDYSRHELLALLDSATSPDNIMVIGTTNFIDQIPDQMVCRPSRFGLIMEMPRLGLDERMSFVSKKYPFIDQYTVMDIMETTDDLPLDYLVEACKLHIMGYDMEEIRERINSSYTFSEKYDED